MAHFKVVVDNASGGLTVDVIIKGDILIVDLEYAQRVGVGLLGLMFFLEMP